MATLLGDSVCCIAQCAEVSIYDCDDVIIQNLLPETLYSWTVTDTFENEYTGEGTTDLLGNLTIAAIELPGLLTYGGSPLNLTIPGQVITINDVGYDCVLIKILQTVSSTDTCIGTGGMNIVTTNPVPIVDFLGVAMRNASANGARSGDPVFIPENLDANWQMASLHPDPINGGYHYTSAGSDGYEIVESEVIARGYTLETYLDGVGNVTYGFSFLEDAIAFLQEIGVTKAVVGINITPLLIQVMNRVPLNGIYPRINLASVNFAGIYNELGKIKGAFDASTVSIYRWLFSTEMGINNQSNIVLNEYDYADLCGEIISQWCIPNTPNAKRTVDAYEVDDTSRPLTNYNAINGALNVTGIKNYYQFKELTYALNRARVAELPAVMDLFQAEFPGKEMHIEQTTFSIGNPLRLKVGQGLIISELIMKIIPENKARGTLITDLIIYNISQMIAGNNGLYPLLKFIQFIRGVLINDGLIEISFDGVEGSENLVSLAVKTPTGWQAYILNPTDTEIVAAGVNVDGTETPITASSIAGISGLVTDSITVEQTGTEPRFAPYSLNMIEG